MPSDRQQHTTTDQRVEDKHPEPLDRQRRKAGSAANERNQGGNGHDRLEAVVAPRTTKGTSTHRERQPGILDETDQTLGTGTTICEYTAKERARRPDAQPSKCRIGLANGRASNHVRDSVQRITREEEEPRALDVAASDQTLREDGAQGSQ